MQFDPTEDYILENHRVRLEPLKIHHTKELEKWAEEDEIWTYFVGRSNGKDDFENYIEDAVQSREMGKEFPMVVYDKEYSGYAGCTRFFDFDNELGIIRLGYTWYGKQFWGTGLNTNCKFLLFEFAFEQLKAERIGLGAHEENGRSLAAMKSVGCIEEGVIRNAFPGITKAGRADAILLGILREEWYESVKEKLKQKI